MIIIVLAIVSLMVALDATILVPVLPVGDFHSGAGSTEESVTLSRPSPRILGEMLQIPFGQEQPTF